jgi:hypothetical protein
MTEDKTAGLIFALGLNDPEHGKRAKEIVAKVAQKRLQIHEISTEKGLHPSKIAVDKGFSKDKISTQKGFGVGKISTQKGLAVSKISIDKGMTLADLAKAHENGLWVEHVEKIVKKHREQYGAKNEHIPAQLASSLKMKCADLFKKHHEHEIKELFANIKKDKSAKAKVSFVKAAQSKGSPIRRK